MTEEQLSQWTLCQSQLRLIRDQYPQLSKDCDQLSALSTAIDSSLIYVLDSKLPADRKHFIKAMACRARTLFDGVISLKASENDLGAFILLRALLELLASFAYVRKYPKRISAMFIQMETNRPATIGQRLNCLFSEWPRARNIYKILSCQAHAMEARYLIQRVPQTTALDLAIAHVYQPHDQARTKVVLRLLGELNLLYAREVFTALGIRTAPQIYQE